MVRYGQWQNDAVPTWVGTATVNSTQGANNSAYVSGSSNSGVDADPNLQGTWEGSGSETPAGGPGLGYPGLTVWWNNQIGQVIDPDVTSGSRWVMAWLTLSRLDSTVTSGVLPATVRDPSTGAFVDPDVVGVEWMPEDTPTDQRLTISLRSGYRRPDGTTIAVKYGANPSTIPYDPGFLTAALVNGKPTLAIIPATSTSVVIPSPPIGASGAGTIAIGLVDEYTATQSSPQAPPTRVEKWVEAQYPFDMKLEGLYAPRYRLIYRTQTRPAYNRIVQRGSDGLGMTGGKRIIQNRSQQSTNRRGAGFR